MKKVRKMSPYLFYICAIWTVLSLATVIVGISDYCTWGLKRGPVCGDPITSIIAQILSVPGFAIYFGVYGIFNARSFAEFGLSVLCILGFSFFCFPYIWVIRKGLDRLRLLGKKETISNE